MSADYSDPAPEPASHETRVSEPASPDAPVSDVEQHPLAPASRSALPTIQREALPATLPVRKRRAAPLVVALLVGAGAIGTGAWYWYQSSRGLPEGLIQANGRIESDVINISGKLAGRIVTLAAREGDVVKAGAVLVQLDDRSLRAQLQAAQSALATATARSEAARVSLAVMRKEVPVSISIARANVASAEAAERRALAAEAQSQRDSERAQRLVSDGSVPKQTAEQAELAWHSSQDERAVAQANRAQAEQSLHDALLGPDRIRAKESELLAMETTRREAAARVTEAETAVEDLRVTSPIDAIVTSRFANLGEVVNAGMPLLELVDLDRLYLKVYVPEKEIGKVRRDLPARIYSDAFPQQPFDARVRYIASRAEFTPKEVQTPDERTKLVYEVRLYLDRNPDHKLTPGLPADAVIRWKENVAWTPPRW